ncbi:hypothetical protein DCC35_09325 [Mangrovivirga cuniculi]|uniref:Uncharacterized protein n=1 Tax=Mangrovivirga cuniculi TaxID=2715131 RepID=A0A4D7JSC1_9BACT|nr:hypothetical protein DCC35_09325 [Mangrovivirga cuniculi]
MRKKLYIKIPHVVQISIMNLPESNWILLSGYSKYLREYLNLSYQIIPVQILEKNCQSHG